MLQFSLSLLVDFLKEQLGKIKLLVQLKILFHSKYHILTISNASKIT